LWIGHALGGAKDAEELVALTANAAKHPEFLKDHGPGDDREDCKQEQDAAGDPARLSKNVTEISDKNRSEQKNDATPQLVTKFSYFKNVTHAHRAVKTNRMRKKEAYCLFGTGTP
jgi:citrate lyase alpha subunit